MKTLNKSYDPEPVFEWVEQWLDHLCRGEFPSAHEMLHNVSDCSPDAIQTAIETLGSGDATENRFKVTDYQRATGCLLRADTGTDGVYHTFQHPVYPFTVTFLEEPTAKCVGWVVIDYPLDGAWSPLSSEFNISYLPDLDRYAIELTSIRVM